MQPQLAGVDCRKEVLAKTDGQRQAREAEDQKTTREEFPMIQTQLQQVRVTSLDRIKTALEAVMNAPENASPLFLLGVLMSLSFFLHQVHDQRRHQSS